MKGTRIDLLREMEVRVKGTDLTSSRITVVCGIPGSGKSTIAKTIAVGLADQGLLAASFFFSWNHASRRELKLVFSTIAFQMAQHSKDYRQHLSEILEGDPDLISALPSKQLDKLILEPLSRVSFSGDKPWVLVLDALDECGSDHGHTLLQLLTSNITRFSNHVRFFLTGRPEAPITTAFKSSSIEPITYMHTLQVSLNSAVSTDIRRYVEASLNGQWRGRNGWIVDDCDIEALVERAGGLFVFAATAVRHIHSSSIQHPPQKAMRFMLDTEASAFRPLDELYLHIVSNAVPADDMTFITLYRRVLGAITHLQEPLSTKTLAGLLNLPHDEVSPIVQMLSSVLLDSSNHQSGSDRTVRLAHLSFQEFITTPHPNSSRPDLFLDSAAHHNDLAQSCIAHMNAKLHRNMCALDRLDTYSLNADIPELKNLVVAYIPSSLRYACTQWASHLPMAYEINARIFEEWLSKRVLFWIEALSLCEELTRAIPLITFADRWYRDTQARTSQMLQDVPGLNFDYSSDCPSRSLALRRPHVRHQALYCCFLRHNQPRRRTCILFSTTFHSHFVRAGMHVQPFAGGLCPCDQGCRGGVVPATVDSSSKCSRIQCILFRRMGRASSPVQLIAPFNSGHQRPVGSSPHWRGIPAR